MKIHKGLRERIQQDIKECEGFSEREGSKMYFNQLVSRYSVIDTDFTKNLSITGKTASVGKEFDYRPELIAIASKLRMWLLVDDTIDNQKKADVKREPVIFISHRSTDKEIAEMIHAFLIGTGIPRDYVFCSSLPGNDVKEIISEEIRTAMNSSVINIAILSRYYYLSAYCLNEAGVLWFCCEKPVVPVALPEISSENMSGFLSNNYKIRRLDCEADISYLYDSVQDAVSAQKCSASVLTDAKSKLIRRYEDYIETRSEFTEPKSADDTFEMPSDDEAIVLYYILSKQVRKVKKGNITEWLTDEEIYDVDVDNAFDLLSTLGNGNCGDELLELDIAVFREYSRKRDDMLSDLHVYLEKHRKLSRHTFKTMWQSAAFDDAGKLFISYIIDERITTFGDRWMAEQQIEHIKSWESKHDLYATLSTNYGSCLSMFIENRLVYESDWTSYGNPRQYSLCISLKNYLFSPDCPHKEELNLIKQNFYIDLPF